MQPLQRTRVAPLANGVANTKKKRHEPQLTSAASGESVPSTLTMALSRSLASSGVLSMTVPSATKLAASRASATTCVS
jgi:hypothetical protein